MVTVRRRCFVAEDAEDFFNDLEAAYEHLDEIIARYGPVRAGEPWSEEGLAQKTAARAAISRLEEEPFRPIRHKLLQAYVQSNTIE